MIKEILLSLAVAAFSGVSSFVGSPKRQITDLSQVWGTYDFDFEVHGDDYFDLGWENPFMVVNHQQVDIDGDWHACQGNSSNYGFDVRGTLENGSINLQCNMTFYTSNDDFKNKIVASLNFAMPDASYQDWTHQVPGKTSQGVDLNFFRTVPVEQADYTLNFTLKEIYSLRKNFVNCDTASSPRLPDKYTSDGQLSYYVLMVANVSGYGFTVQSLHATGGITIRNFNLFDQYNNSGYYASLSFTVDLPLNDCSLIVEAFLPRYTITTNLERCTVSPDLPSSYTGTSFSGDYTFTADSGYGFNKNYTHWEVTNLFIDSVEFSALLWGSFYSSVTLHLRASGGNSSISVTAIEYDEENYKLGYEEGRADGWQAGYDRGHADGEIAGDSYGVWNWLKQAAITTGEFLSINLLPGFSIGALLTALAGLVIIWFFIKGFLFKS